jgi:hypothetical protein
MRQRPRYRCPVHEFACIPMATDRFFEVDGHKVPDNRLFCWACNKDGVESVCEMVVDAVV